MSGERVELRDGSAILVRPIESTDKRALEEGLEHMSPESRYFRFFSPIRSFSPAQLRYLTEVDHHDHEALIAMSETGEAVGVARFVRLGDEPDTAEAAVTVVDAWQERGVATGLLERLAQRARQEGIHRFIATALADNHAVRDLLTELGPAQTRHADPGLVEMRIELPASAEAGSPLRRALRLVARGRLAIRRIAP